MADHVTDNTITPSEYIRMVSLRAKHLKLGKTPLIEWKGAFDPIAIAKSEIKQRVLPMAIVRKIPDCTSETGFRDEIWNIKDLNIRDF